MAEERTHGRRKGKQTEHAMEPRSKVWPYFTRFTDEDGIKKAQCKRCQKVLLAIHGTRSLRKHKDKCWGQESAPAAAALPWPELRGGSSSGREPVLELEEASKHLARMIALRGHDPSVLEDDCFRSFVASLNAEFEMPSRVAIEEMCDGIFDEARRDAVSRVRRAPGRLCFALGKAKTIEAGEVMCVACHFVDDQWKLHKVVMDAIVLAEHHCFEDGPILGAHVAGDAADDNVIDVISEHEDHGLSMVAYDTADENVGTSLKDYIEEMNSGRNLLSCTTATYVDNVLRSIAQCLLPSPHFGYKVFKDMRNLKLTRQERLQLLSELGLDYEWAYHEHWCAFYFSLEVLRKRGIVTEVGDAGLFVDADLFVKLFCKILGQVYHGIQRISSASTGPTSNLCLAELLKLREFLHSELARLSGDDAADVQDTKGYFFEGTPRDALSLAIDTLDEAIQDSYLVWSVPLALDPRYKLSYIEFSFERAFGSEEAAEYISEVTANIHDLYADYITEYGTTNAADHSVGANAMMATISADPWEQAWNDYRRPQDVTGEAAQVNNPYYPEIQTELDRYLQDPLALATQDFDVLSWWKENNCKYPTVARMARDALAMPTCSKLASGELAQVKNIVRGYSKEPYWCET